MDEGKEKSDLRLRDGKKNTEEEKNNISEEFIPIYPPIGDKIKNLFCCRRQKRLTFFFRLLWANETTNDIWFEPGK